MELIQERNACDQNEYSVKFGVAHKPLYTSCHGELSKNNDYTYVGLRSDCEDMLDTMFGGFVVEQMTME